MQVLKLKTPVLRLLWVLAAIIAPMTLHGQMEMEDRFIEIRYIESPIKIDGILDEIEWKTAPSSGDFWQRFPADTSMAEAQTEAKLLYDDNFLYVGFICHDLREGGFVVNSMKRDFTGFGNDYVNVVIDPFGDRINAFEFAVTPLGAERDALITGGGMTRNSTNSSWDNKWYSRVSYGDGQWFVEMAIPFKTLRYKDGSREWLINFGRYDYKNNERTNWSWIPRNFRSTTLGYLGRLVWDKPLKKTGKNISVIPYLTGGLTKDYESGDKAKLRQGVGGDVKVGLSSSLNLDLTINPDFSQVEVDRQVTNLDRFEINFPERRQFFLENNDLFADFGSNSLRPFFTRRIGIAEDTAGNTVENKILGGVRLSGKLNKDWRVGLLNMQTAKDEDLELRSTNYTVGVLQRNVFKRSNISALFVNKHQFELDDPEDTLALGSPINRVVGIDYNHFSANNAWSGKVFYHRSFNETGSSSEAYSHGVRMAYETRIWEATWEHEIVGEDYQAEVGFIRRTGYKRITPEVKYKWYPEGRVNRYEVSLKQDLLWSNGVGLSDRITELDLSIRFTNVQFLRIGYEQSYVKLTRDFDPTRTDGEELLEGTDYNTHGLTFFYLSDYRKPLNMSARGYFGQYYNGFRSSVGGTLTYRLQTLGTISMDYSINRVSLPKPYNSANLFLVGPRVDLTLARNIFFSTLIQYNNQINNININTRFQWRFKPVSDFYVVYTDNYYAEHLKVKNRGIVFKLTYWLNV